MPRVAVRPAVSVSIVVAPAPAVRRSVRWAEPAVVVGYLFVMTVALVRMAAVRPFWFDELFTLHLARSPGTLLSNLAAGVDLNPPLSYLLTAACVGLFGESEWAVRLPSVAGAVLAVGGLYLFVRHRRGPAEAMLAAAAVGATPPVWIFFVEARPYGLLVGLTAVLLVAWQRRSAWGVAAVGSLAVLTHYYAVLPLLGLGVAELFRRPIDRRMWLGFVATAGTLLMLAPLWRTAPKAYAAGFWARPKLTRAAVEDGYFGLVTRDLAVPVAVGLMAAGVASGLRQRAGGSEAQPRPTDYPRWEAVALAAVALGPAVGVFVGAKLTGGYFYRYSVPCVLGLAGLFALAVGRASGGSRLACYLTAAAFAVTGPAAQWAAAPGYFRIERAGVHETAAFLAAHADGPVLVDSGFDFVHLWHYTAAAVLYPADPAAAYRQTKVDTVERGLAALAPVAGVPVTTFDAVPAGAFYLGTRGSWRAKELVARGWRLEPVADRGPVTLFRLGRNQPARSQRVSTVWYRVFGRSDRPVPPAALAAHLHAAGVPAEPHFRGDDLGWTSGELVLPGGGTPVRLDRYLTAEDDLRDDLNAHAAELETMHFQPHHRPLMEHVIQTQQMMTARRPLDHANESLLDTLLTETCRFLAAGCDGVYQIDGQGWFAADGTQLIQEY